MEDQWLNIQHATVGGRKFPARAAVASHPHAARARRFPDYRANRDPCRERIRYELP